MIPAKTLSLIDELRAKGWFFNLRADKTGWDCYVLGTGLAFGNCCSPRMDEAVQMAIAQARAMVDDPKTVIKAHGSKIKGLVEKCFGKGSFLGLDAVEWEPEQPRRLCIRVKGSSGVQLSESNFFAKALKVLPNDVTRHLTFEVDWPEEAKT